MIKQFNINTPEDVTDFLRYIQSDLECNIHPDDDFRDVIDIKTEEPYFSNEDAKKLNSYMDRCFRICTYYNKNIYELAILVDKGIYGKY